MWAGDGACDIPNNLASCGCECPLPRYTVSNTEPEPSNGCVASLPCASLACKQACGCRAYCCSRRRRLLRALLHRRTDVQLRHERLRLP